MTTNPDHIDHNVLPNSPIHHNQQQHPPTPKLLDNSSTNSNNDISLQQPQQLSQYEQCQSHLSHDDNQTDTIRGDDDSSGNTNRKHLSTEKMKCGEQQQSMYDDFHPIEQRVNSTNNVLNVSSFITQQTQQNASVTPSSTSTPTTTMNDNKQSQTPLSTSTSTSSTKSRSSSFLDPNRTDKAGRTKLFALTGSGDLVNVKSLVAQGADVNFQDHAGWVPLHEAALKGQYAVACFLIESGANVNARGYGDDTPLHDACSNSHADMVRLLVDAGADVFALNANKQQPVDVCKTQTCHRIVKTKMKQLDRLSMRDWTGKTRLHLACANGLLDDVAKLVGQGANIHAEDRQRWTPLHFAVVHGHLPIVKLLTQHGADINYIGSQGDTVLHHACLAGRENIARFLINHPGINIHVQNDSGKTAYQITTSPNIRRDLAAKIDDERKLRATSDAIDEITFTTLRQRQRSNNSTSSSSSSSSSLSSTMTTSTTQKPPLSREERKIQAIMKSFQVLEQQQQQQQQSSQPTQSPRQDTTTMENGESKNSNSGNKCDKSSSTKLIPISSPTTKTATATAASTSLPVTTTKSKSKAPMKLRERRQKQSTNPPSNILDTASVSNHTTSNSIKPTLNKRDANGRTQLHRRAARGDVDQVKVLLQEGADPNIGDNAGFTPLHESSLNGRSDVVKVLLENGADVNWKGTNSETPLHDAIDNEHTDVVDILLKFGADPFLKNSKGVSPIQTAMEQNLNDIRLLLQSAILDWGQNYDQSNSTSTTSPTCLQQSPNEALPERRTKKRRLMPPVALEPSSSHCYQHSPTLELQHGKTNPSSLIGDPMDIHMIPENKSSSITTTTTRQNEPTPPSSLSSIDCPPPTPVSASMLDNDIITWKKRKQDKGDRNDMILLDGDNHDDRMPGTPITPTTSTPTTTVNPSTFEPSNHLPLYTVLLTEDNEQKGSLCVLDLQVALIMNLSTDMFWQRYPHLRRWQVTFKEKQRLWAPLARLVCTSTTVAQTPSHRNFVSTKTVRQFEKQKFLDLSLNFVHLDSVALIIKREYDHLRQHLISINLDIGYQQDEPPQQQQPTTSTATQYYTDSADDSDSDSDSSDNVNTSRRPSKKRFPPKISGKYDKKNKKNKKKNDTL